MKISYDASSLHWFVENNRKEENSSILSNTPKEFKINSRNVPYVYEPISRTSKDAQGADTSSHYSYPMGPLIKLPVETKVVMRVENTLCSRAQASKPKAQEKNLLNKIEKACCLDSGCLKQLSLIDATTEELKSRAGKLAHREAERVELLERAEAAWKDLETGFQRRLTLAEEKEEDIIKQITKFMDARTRHKELCTILAQKLKEKSQEAEKKHTFLNELEKKLCECACQRLKLFEESAKHDSLVTEHSCRIAQLDRDLLFKEEEEKRIVQSLKDEVESARALSLEAERALRAELSTLRDQIADVSKQLLEEDSKNNTIRTTLECLRSEKMELVEVLDGCKTVCDGRMQGIVDELTKKRDQVNELKKKVIECRCKMPIDVAVEVKRTPSFAALCKCTSGDKILESCSCTSMRTKLLSNLLADLFGGLHFELAGWVTLMPCQLLKCLEDNYNWDSSSSVKTSLKNYFSVVLAGELDIAIATSIEDYHIRWVGPSCADKIKAKVPENECCQEREIECHAQELATQLAKQLFHEGTENKTQCPRLPSVSMQTIQPSCECYPGKEMKTCSCQQTPSTLVYWHQTMQDVTKLRQQVEDLKKDYLKKDDFKRMENKFAQILPPSKDCCSSKRDKNEETRQRPVKKSYGKVASLGGNGKASDGKMRIGVAVNETAVFPCLVNNIHQADKEAPVSGTATYWHHAIQNFTQLRLQIEDLKRDSIKKEDLKVMGDKIAEIVHRASGGNTLSSAKMDYITTGSVVNEVIKKEHKIRKTQNTSRVHNFDFNNKSKKGYNNKFIKKNGVEKPFKHNKKNDYNYAVNLCLCGGKAQQSNLPHEKYKVETSVWKQNSSKNVVSQISSSIRQAKPINNSLFSQNISTRTSSKESEEQKCTSNCVCFHKIPSNTSIDLLLETLTNCKSLDEQLDLCIEKHIQKSSHVGYPISQNFKKKSRDKTSLEKFEESGDAVIKQKPSLERPDNSKISKYSDKVCAKSADIIGTTDSEYMGTVNLDKSNEEICITSNSRSVKTQMCTETENQQEVNSIQKIRNQDDVKKNNLKGNANYNKILESSEKQPAKDSEAANENLRVLQKTDYQIKLLGVTLFDATSSTRNPVKVKNSNDKSSNKSILTPNNILSGKEFEISKSTTSTKYQENHVYRANNSNTILGLSELSNSINKNSKNIFTDKNKEKIKKHENKDKSKKIDYYSHKQESSLGYKEEISDGQVGSRNDRFKLDFGKVSTDQEILEMTTPDGTRTTKNISFKMCDKEETIVENLNITQRSTLTNESIRETLGKHNMVTCKCGVKFDELKRLISIHFPKQIVSEDIALDVQSLRNFNNADESCICCNELCTGESKDLEDNAFHLLEEFLKKKLEELKTSTSSYSCITQEQEEKFFTIILQRVKQLILDSTNQITCKCSTDEQKSEGSWNRAYGLLQEYINMKIKKVQCSCSLAENNSETVLPGVLEKICKLIENDFKRLNVTYGSINYPHSQNDSNKYLKQTTYTPEKSNVSKNTRDVSLDIKNKLPNIPQVTQDQTHEGKKPSFIKQCTPLTVSMEDEFRNLSKAFTNDINIKSSTHSRDKYQDYNQYNNGIQLLRTNCNLPKITIDEILVKQEHIPKLDLEEFKEKNHSIVAQINRSVGKIHKHNIVIGSKKTISSQVLISSNTNSTTECLPTETSNCSVCIKPAIITSTGIMKPLTPSSELEQVNLPCIHETKNQQYSELILNNDTIQKSQRSTNGVETMPYIGYTIDCSCHDSLGVCICPKSMLKGDTALIDNIWKNSVPDETYLKKISYIMPKENINQNTGLLEMSNNIHLQGVFETNEPDNHLKECETTCNKNEELVLVKSLENNNIKQTHATTNTFDENTSSDNIVFSVNEDILDSYECSSHRNPNEKSDSERLKNSLYFQTPIDIFEDSLKYESFLNKNLKSQLPIGSLKQTCDCERIPICHIKMLVEDIETKLANADCTCDSLISTVCPVHASLS